jgi:peptidoglycan-N-acetylglucosamine deacetylase
VPQQRLADKLPDELSRSGDGIVLLRDVQDQTARAVLLLFQALKKKAIEW